MNEIPAHIADKVDDKNWNDTFIFENMTCGHNHNSNEFETLNCDHCKCVKRENWLEECLSNCNSNETLTTEDKTETLTKIVVARGKFDDVIGITKVFN